MSKLYVIVVEEAWETDKHNVESCFQEAGQGHEKRVSRLFGEDEWAPQQPSALGSSAICEGMETKYSTGPVPNLPALQLNSVFCPDLGKNWQWQFSCKFTDKRAMKCIIKVFCLKAMTDPCLSKGQSLALEISVFLPWAESETPLECFSAIRNIRVISKMYASVGGVRWVTQ